MSKSIKACAGAAAMLMVWTGTLVSAAGAAACKEPKTGTDQVPILSPPLGQVVIGKGRLPFYSAPDIKCEMKGVFVVPRDFLVAYAATGDGWMSVMYMRSGVQGWVRSSRLKTTGTMGPSQ